MLANPLVSVAIVTWNRREEVSTVVENCYEQSYKNIEIIVVDNASEDGTYEHLVKNYPGIKLVSTHKNLGCVPGQNFAMANCTGDIVFCLYDDGLPDDRCIERIVTAFQESEDVALVTCNILDPDKKDTKISDEFKTLDKSYVPVFLGTGFAIKRVALDEVGYFPDYFRQGEENYLALRILDAGYKICFDPAAIVYHHWNFSEKGGNYRQILYLSFRHDLENIKRLLPFRYAFPVISYKVVVNLGTRYLRTGYPRYFFSDFFKVLPILLTDYKEIKIETFRSFNKEAARFFEEKKANNNSASRL